MSLCYNKVSLVFLILSLLNTLKQRKQSNMKLKQIYVRCHEITYSIVSACEESGIENSKRFSAHAIK